MPALDANTLSNMPLCTAVKLSVSCRPTTEQQHAAVWRLLQAWTQPVLICKVQGSYAGPVQLTHTMQHHNKGMEKEPETHENASEAEEERRDI